MSGKFHARTIAEPIPEKSKWPSYVAFAVLLTAVAGVICVIASYA